MARITLRADVTGVVFSIEAEVGAQVHNGDPVMFLESMKMEIPVTATADGRIAEFLVAVGDAVEENAPVVVIEAEG